MHSLFTRLSFSSLSELSLSLSLFRFLRILVFFFCDFCFLLLHFSLPAATDTLLSHFLIFLVPFHCLIILKFSLTFTFLEHSFYAMSHYASKAFVRFQTLNVTLALTGIFQHWLLLFSLSQKRQHILNIFCILSTCQSLTIYFPASALLHHSVSVSSSRRSAFNLFFLVLSFSISTRLVPSHVFCILSRSLPTRESLSKQLASLKFAVCALHHFSKRIIQVSCKL